jgi:hypothetical protein
MGFPAKFALSLGIPAILVQSAELDDLLDVLIHSHLEGLDSIEFEDEQAQIDEAFLEAYAATC